MEKKQEADYKKKTSKKINYNNSKEKNLKEEKRPSGRTNPADSF